MVRTTLLYGLTAQILDEYQTVEAATVDLPYAVAEKLLDYPERAHFQVWGAVHISVDGGVLSAKAAEKAILKARRSR